VTILSSRLSSEALAPVVDNGNFDGHIFVLGMLSPPEELGGKLEMHCIQAFSLRCISALSLQNMAHCKWGLTP